MVLKVYRQSGVIQNVKSVVYKAAVNADVDIRPGCVSSAFITVEVYGSQSTAPAVGEMLACFRVDDVGNETILGLFFAEPAVSSRTTYTITAYDAIHKFDVDYSARLAEIQEDFPMTLGDLIGDVCDVAGVDTVVEDIPLHDMAINAFYADNLTCRDILAYAAELNGQYVVADANGDAVFTWYWTENSYRINPSAGTDDDVALIAYKQNGLEYAKYTIQPPPAVAVKPSGVDGAAYIYPSSVSQAYATDPNGDGNVILYNLVAVDDGSGNITLSGGGLSATASGGDVELSASGGGSVDGAMIVSGNILLTGASSATYLAVAEQIYTAMQEIPTYRPARANLFPLESTSLELGTVIPVTDSQGVSFYMPIMSMTISNAAMVVEATGNETRSDKNPTEKTLANLAADIVQINKLKVDWAEINEAIINTVEANELKSSDFVPANDNIFAESGMAIDLAGKTVKAVDFAVDGDGKLYASAADIAGVQFDAAKAYSNLVWNSAGSQDGYYKYGAIPYRNLVEISISGVTDETIDAKFDYYNGSELVHQAEVEQTPVSPFRIPLYTGDADRVIVFLKVLGGQTATIYTRNVVSSNPVMNVPADASVTFGSGIYIDGKLLDASTIVSAKRFTATANNTTNVSVDTNTCGVIMFSGLGAGARGLYFFACGANGTVYLTTAFAASALTLTAGTNAVTIASTNAYDANGVMINF